MKPKALIASFLLGLSLILFILPAFAEPSLNGYTGLINIPDANALGRGHYNVAFTFLDVSDSSENNIVANYGIGDNIEVGVGRIRAGDSDFWNGHCNDSSDNNDGTIINAKYQFAVEDARRPSLAVGVIDLTNELNTSVYFVATKSLTKCVRTYGGETIAPQIHLGLGGGALESLFGGVTLPLGNKFTVLAEYDTNNINVGARLAIGPRIRVYAATINDFDDLAVGASYNVGF